MKPQPRLIISIFVLLSCLTAVYGDTGYKVVQENVTASQIKLTLSYVGTDEYYVKSTSPHIKNLLFTYNQYSFSDFNFKITDLDSERFEIPQVKPFPVDPLDGSTFPINTSAVSITYTKDPFNFKIVRKSTNAVIFSTYDCAGGLIYSEHYLEICTHVDSQQIYGLGERFGMNFRKTAGKWTIFTRDRPEQIDYGTGKQTYGHYPLYMLREKARNFHFSYLRNSNAMDVEIAESKNRTSVRYRVIGGVLDFRFVLGETSAEAALERWNLFMGRSAVPPFWSMGFHQCRWGYKDITYLQKMIAGYKDNQIPLDTVWTDIDYMVKYQDFTIDEARFPLDRMKAITDEFHYVPIIDAGIKVGNGTAYKQGQERNVFIKTALGKEYNGVVWPGPTAFVDFLSPNATQYWVDMLGELYKKVNFSGVWLDMNEYSNFCNGTCAFVTEEESGGFDYNKDLPYQPSHENRVEVQTISLNATHYNGTKEANVHVLNSMLQTHATNVFLQSHSKRPFIISRSSTLGSNMWGFHWTGDNFADFQFLRSSIADNFNFQLYGIQMVGADICGFGGNAQEELCSRWFQVGALYPFSRDHNQNAAIGQQPYALGKTVLESAQNNLRLRYSILKHYYSTFVSKSGTGSIFRPAFMTFSSDDKLYEDDICNYQFMIGDSLMATPIVYEHQRNRSIYLPAVEWYDFHTGKNYASGTHQISNSLTEKIPLFLRASYGVFKQQVDGNITKTRQLGNVFQLVLAVSEEKKEDGNSRTDNGANAAQYQKATAQHISIENYNDDAKVSECIKSGCLYEFEFTLTEDNSSNGDSLSLQITCVYSGALKLNEELTIDKLVLYLPDGVIEHPLKNPITFKGTQNQVISGISKRQTRHQKISLVSE